MAKLIATRNILYQNRFYEGGDELPYYDKATVDAWVDAGSAKWLDDKKAKAEVVKTPAEPKAEAEEPKAEEPKVAKATARKKGTSKK